MRKALDQDRDDRFDFDCHCYTSDNSTVTKEFLGEQVRWLFRGKPDMVLFYFSGHGFSDGLDTYLATQDFSPQDPGFSLTHLITAATKSKAKEVIIILDACYSGAAGNFPLVDENIATLREGISILTSSRHDEKSENQNGRGFLTRIIVDGLNGVAADLLGNVTITGLYRLADSLPGSWDQRPVFKCHVSQLTPIQKYPPAIPLATLKKLTRYFKEPDFEHQLSPSHEPMHEDADKNRTKIFADLQQMRGAGLVEPIGHQHMYYAALESGSCTLTPLGRFYWNMVKRKRIR